MLRSQLCRFIHSLIEFFHPMHAITLPLA
ncbi:MAG: hypothetical protein RJB09_297, partial [Pseudomonadota bacterium]